MGIERASLVIESLNALHESVQETLETLAYAEAIPVQQPAAGYLPLPYYVTTVDVRRPYAGRIRLMISRDLAISLVGSMLGAPDRMDEEWVQDGLSELVNTIGGRILAHLVDSYSSFDLGIPQTECVNAERSRPSGLLVRQTYAVNDGHLELELEFQKAQAA